MAPKRAASGEGSSASKIPKTEHNNPDDFSNSVKKKLSNSSRTGQACDRCKVRKIRCDGRLGGCSPCLQNNTPCKTTDRITGRATTRGHTEALESENAYLRQVINDLQSQLKELGVEVKPLTPYNGYMPAPMPAQGVSWTGSEGIQHAQSPWSIEQTPGSANEHNMMSFPGSMTDQNATQQLEESILRSLPAFKASSPGDNYLGVSSADSVLSPIKGMSLAVFGTEIDLTDFVPNNMDDTNSTMSYQHCWRVIMNKDPDVEQLQLPDYQEAREFALWFFRSLNPYTPILTKPAYMRLLSRIYHEPNYVPSAAEIVMVHMVLALIKYQVSIRNSEPIYLEQSNKHYRFALSKVYELLTSHTLEDVQAMSLISLHLRNFPRPGAAWFMTQVAFSMAIELGLNRSARVWAETAPKTDVEEIELRKRVFWTLHGLLVSLSGKLGRPMPLRMEDVDVEMPEPIDDFLPEEAGLNDFHKCSFRVGIFADKIIVLFSQMYSTIYAVRQPPQSYEAAVRKLEQGLRQWRAELPPELSDRSRVLPEDRIFACYLDCWDGEMDLLLHHPAVCRSTNPEFVFQNLTVCLEASSRMLRNAYELKKFKCLDVPWINCTVYIAAIFTTLFVQSQRKDELTSTDMIKLRGDMDMWLEIMEEFGKLLGTGTRLKTAIQQIIDQSLESISGHLVKKTASAASAAVARATLNHPLHSDATGASNSYTTNGNFNAPYTDTTNASNEVKPASYMPPDDPAINHSITPYPMVQSTTQYPYTEGTATSMPPYTHSSNAFDHPPYTVPENDLNVAQAAHAAVVASASAAASHQDPNAYMYSNAGTPTTSAPPYQIQNGNAANAAWRQWTQNAVTNMAPQDYHRPQEYLNSANALMALGGRDSGVQGPSAVPSDSSGVGTGIVDQGQGQMQQHALMWPLVIFGTSEQDQNQR